MFRAGGDDFNRVRTLCNKRAGSPIGLVIQLLGDPQHMLARFLGYPGAIVDCSGNGWYGYTGLTGDILYSGAICFVFAHRTSPLSQYETDS